ncbi:thiamine phosphate synthase [Gorillibacterium timonense]|uniref:thiamine phosphate synthase n=1 Tax=Gorillibacterium timonense TaxID=1689269 RepID=UPI00071E58F1|nr:thiamine phosphate synthase [Gorillibacterium timonense]
MTTKHSHSPEEIRRLLRVYFIMGSPNTVGRPPEEVLTEAIAGGITLFQFREKGPGALTGSAKRELASRLQSICRKAGVPFLVNDDTALAEELNADGVHVGQDDEPAGILRSRLGADKIIGVSAHTLEEARQAVLDGADYIGVGPIYPTSSKPDAEEACGPQLLTDLRSQGIQLPIVAIGGITCLNAAPILAAGANGLSVISAIAGAPDVRQAAADFASLASR